ncbi:annexin A13 isoform X1 [Octopus bimaculoides]|uniref:annexin A13 isoform X1 n=1 Tax=Octopus bimaculoides TaxID=37653 RepID=UPI00071C6E92|nr:annexin A13 isoform X1 [Octopus bimaculoides]|eukprot:XP_014779985.1 PREDICTED: annexin A13-like isoform X1 [Octopus bimaculoides]
MAHGTISGCCDFNCEEACEKLKNAMDGLGTNEADIIDVLVNHNCKQRQEIRTAYKQSYGEDLIDDLKSELSGNLENVIVALFDLPRDFDVHEIHRAIACMGTDENTLIEIMVTRTNEEIEEIKTRYEEEYGVSMEEDIASDTSGYFRRLMVSLCTASRDDDWWADQEKATEDAQALYDAGEGQLGTDECTFNAILCKRTLPQLQATFKAYEELADRPFRDVVESETSGAVQDGYLAIIDAASDLRHYFAQRLYKSMKGLGTTDTDLIRVIVSRSELDLQEIKEDFLATYDTALSDFVESDCGGEYKTVLLKVIGA